MAWIVPVVMLAANVIQGAVAKKKEQEIADTLKDQKLDYPSAYRVAEEKLRDLENIGLPGAEVLKERVDSMIPQNLAQLKEVATSPGDVLGAVAEMGARSTQQKTDIDIADLQQKVAASKDLVSFLSQVAGPTQMNIQQQMNQNELGALMHEGQGLNALMTGINRGVSTGAQTYTAIKQTQAMKEYLDSMKEYWGGLPSAYGVEKAGANGKGGGAQTQPQTFDATAWRAQMPEEYNMGDFDISPLGPGNPMTAAKYIEMLQMQNKLPKGYVYDHYWGLNFIP